LHGAQHCTVRIIASGDYLYVQMGDTTDTNNDCRSAADTMYCSPRSFWTDMVVERKTQICKSVE
jgi:Tfp pilus assembly protein PilX